MALHRRQRSAVRSTHKNLARVGLITVAVALSIYHCPAAIAEGLSDSVISTSGPVQPFTLGQRPFSASSSWNTPIAANATYRKIGWPLSARFGVAWRSYSPAIYVAKESYQVISVQYPAGWGYPRGILEIRLPPDADGARGTDGELLVIDGTTVHNFWQFKRHSPTEATARSYGATNITTGSGWGHTSPFLGAGIVAAGASQLAGLLVQLETDRGEIDHALQISIDASLAMPGHTGDAISGDGKNPDGLIREGQRLGIPPAASMPHGLSPLGQKVFRSFQKYGAFVIDVAGGVTNLRAQANAYDAVTITALRQDIARIAPLLEDVRQPDE